MTGVPLDQLKETPGARPGETRDVRVKRLGMRSMRRGIKEMDIILHRYASDRLTQMDDQILALYTKGLNTRDIVDAFKEMYDADISATLVFKVTERVIDQVHEQQNRPVDPIYPIVYLDCIVLKIRQDKRVIDKSLYLALEPEGTAGPVSCRNRRREVLDVGTDETEDPWSGGHPDRLRGRS